MRLDVISFPDLAGTGTRLAWMVTKFILNMAVNKQEDDVI